MKTARGSFARVNTTCAEPSQLRRGRKGFYCRPFQTILAIDGASNLGPVAVQRFTTVDGPMFVSDIFWKQPQAQQFSH